MFKVIATISFLLPGVHGSVPATQSGFLGTDKFETYAECVAYADANLSALGAAVYPGIAAMRKSGKQIAGISIGCHDANQS